MGRPFRISAAVELYADLGNTVSTLNGNGKYDARIIGAPAHPTP